MNWAEETWQGVFQGPGHQRVSDPPLTTLASPSLPTPSTQTSRHQGGCPPHANACGTQVQAADAVMKILQKVKDSGPHPDLITSQS